MIKNIFKLNYLLTGISVLFFYGLISGCVKSSIISTDQDVDLETEKISESMDSAAQQEKEKELQTVEKVLATKKIYAEIAKLAKKQKVEQKAKQSLGFNNLSAAKKIVLKAKTLHLQQKDIEAINLLTENWDKIILPDTELKKTELLDTAPSAEAYYLKGEISLLLARKESDVSKSKTLYENAIRAYYKILSSYDANKSPYSTAAVKGFTACRRDMLKKFKIKVGFPPEL
jgi:hypothetical protein